MGWRDDGTGWMGSLMPLRSDLLRGDLRCLYLGWLRSAQDGGIHEDAMEPPVPAGLQELSGPLDALIEFLGIDEDLVEVAAQASKPLAAGPSRKELSAWIRGLPEKDKNELLIAAGVESSELWRSNLIRRFQRQNSQHSSQTVATARRSAGDILAVAHARAKERIQQMNEQRAVEEARRKAEDEAKRARFLDQLGRREPEIWEQVAVHILKRQPNDYARAVGLLTDLHDLAVRRGKRAKFQMELREDPADTRRQGELLASTCQGKLVGRLIATPSKQSSRTARCDAGVTQNLPSLPKLTSLTVQGDRF